MTNSGSPEPHPDGRLRIEAPVADRAEVRGPTVPFRPPIFLPWALAAGFGALTIWLGQSLLTLRKEAANQQTESRLNELALRETRNRLEAERIVLDRRLADATQQLAAVHEPIKSADHLAHFQIAALLPAPDHASPLRAVAVWDTQRNEGVLSVENLPPLPQDEDYQLWLVDPSGRNPASGGVFSVAGGVTRIRFKSDRSLIAIRAFAVTRGPKGGTARPEGPFVLQSQDGI
jgi:hypothetical protein